MDTKKTAWLILLLSFIAFNLLWYFADDFAAWTKTGDPVLVAIGYLFTNPEHLAIIFIMANTKKVRGFIASLFVVTAFDIASWAHFITQSGALPAENSSYAGLDTIIYRFILSVLNSFPLGTYGLYVVLCTSLLIIALEIVYPRSFVSLVKRVIGVR